MAARPFLCGPKEGVEAEALIPLNTCGIRFTADPNYDQGPYMAGIKRDAGLDAVVTFDRDSFPLVDWDAVRLAPDLIDWQTPVSDQLEYYAEQWNTLPHIINIWNEWKGTGGFEESPLPAQVVNGIARLTRECFGDRQLLAHGSIVDGQASSLQALEWTHVNFADVHEYTKVAPNYYGPPGGEVLDLQKYRDVLPSHVGIIISEIGMSSDEPGEAAQAVYLESIMRHCISLDDLYLVSWFAFHPYNGWGIINLDGVPKPAYWSYQRAAATYVDLFPDPEPEPISMALPTEVYKRMWQSHLPAAEFHPTFGIEKFWMEHYKELGAVTDLQEYRQGKDAYRTFVGGAVHWNDDTGAKIA